MLICKISEEFFVVIDDSESRKLQPCFQVAPLSGPPQKQQIASPSFRENGDELR